MSCDELRPRLPEFLTGALDDAAADQLEEHLAECGACADELAQLLELDEGLSALAGDAAEAAEPAQPADDAAPPLKLAERRSWRGLVLLAAALLVALGLGAWRVLPQRGPRLLAGRLVDEAGQAALREGVALRASEASVLVLSDGSQLELDAGARVVLKGSRRVQLVTGGTWFRVEKGQEPFLIEAAHARVRVLGTVFRVEVRRKTMNKTTMAAASAAVVVAVVTGAVLLETDQDQAQLGAGQAAVASTSGAVSELKTPEEVEAELAPLRQARARLEAENAELRRQAAQLRQRLAKLAQGGEPAEAAPDEPAPAAPQQQPVAPAPASSPEGEIRVRYGDFAQQEAFQRVKWRAAAEGARDMLGHMDTLLSAVKEGRELTRDERIAIHKANQKLVDIVLEVSGKVPTHATGNGEYTHPFVQANLTAEHLAMAGLPLSEEQLGVLRQFGESYEAEWARFQKTYHEDTLILEKVLDELQLKKTYTDQLQSLLTPAQRAVIVKPEIHHVHRFDIYSPIMLVITQAKPLAVTAETPLRGQLEALVKTWGVADADLPRLAPAIDQWAAALQQELPQVEKNRVAMFTLDEALRAGRAQLEAMRSIVMLLPEQSPVRSSVKFGTAFVVPRAVKPEPAKEPAQGE